MNHGVVKWFNNTTKYGFILTSEGSEVFAHFSDIQCDGYKTLKKGERVDFEIQETPKGARAINIKRLDPVRRSPKRNKQNGEKPSSGQDGEVGSHREDKG